MPKMKQVNQTLIIKALKNQAKGKKTLIWVYARGHSVKRDNMLELLVANQNKRKSFPWEKALRGLQSVPGTFVHGLFDCQQLEANDSTTAKKAVLLTNNGCQKMNYLLISACPGYTTLVDDYFIRLKQQANADGSVFLPHAFTASKLP